MFYEEFSFDESEKLPAAEYKFEELKIYYYLIHCIDGIEDFIRLINHEWIHGLIDWATEGGAVVPGQEWEDHYIMRIINFD